MGGQSGGMLRVLGLFLFLVACSSPDRAFWGDDPVRVTIDGRDYDVFVHRGAEEGPGAICLAGVSMTDCRRDMRPSVQVIRLGYARRPEHVAILHAMRQAAMQVSGCTLVEGSAEGDSGVLTARLACPH